MTKRITPGLYIAARRQAAGLSIADVPLEDSAIQSIEADHRFPTDMELQALAWTIPMDITILIAIARGIVPQLCSGCACSEDDACVDPEGNCCFWVEPTLCSNCARDADLSKEMAA